MIISSTLAVETGAAEITVGVPSMVVSTGVTVMGTPPSLTVVQTAVRAVISGTTAVAVEEAVMEDSVLSKTPAGMAELVPKSKSHVAAERVGMVASIVRKRGRWSVPSRRLPRLDVWVGGGPVNDGMEERWEKRKRIQVREDELRQLIRSERVSGGGDGAVQEGRSS